ncbi:MAG: sigma-54-dependent Fis family transcriptional regulator [Planctomycetes bacterium]|nr:sigma-54-dependent Fis family transcriptional regulator [Planctomycetota bacterium]
MTPIDSETLQARLGQLVEEARETGAAVEFAGALRGQAEFLERVDLELDSGKSFPRRYGMIGRSPAMLKVYDLIERVAGSEVSVLVTGPTGAGKELVARAIHDQSKRKGKIFLAENCAAVPANLIESELFGHVKGSFTGAIKDRKGHFAAASGGTIFLDEIGDMPLEMQSKLLRVLEERKVRPVGGNRMVDVDVRLVAATHRDLEKASAEGAFRADLYYRLNVITIHVPSLDERKEDIAPLARFFLAQCNEQMGKQTELSSEAMEALVARSWPGNVRELNNAMQRAVALSSGIIAASDVTPAGF